jgi:hypothetical protein
MHYNSPLPQFPDELYTPQHIEVLVSGKRSYTNPQQAISPADTQQIPSIETETGSGLADPSRRVIQSSRNCLSSGGKPFRQRKGLP